MLPWHNACLDAGSRVLVYVHKQLISHRFVCDRLPKCVKRNEAQQEPRGTRLQYLQRVNRNVRTRALLPSITGADIFSNLQEEITPSKMAICFKVTCARSFGRIVPKSFTINLFYEAYDALQTKQVGDLGG
jgi:hypothetical protein